MLFNLFSSTNNYDGWECNNDVLREKVSFNLIQMLWWYFILDNWYKYDPTNSFEITYCIKNVFRNWLKIETYLDYLRFPSLFFYQYKGLSFSWYESECK